MLGYGVFVSCGYECVALASKGKLPTITKMVHRHRHLPVVELAVWGLLAFGWYHFLVEASE